MLNRLLSSTALVLFTASTSIAAPWDWDMSKQQSYKANEMSRAPAEGTVPLGHKPFILTPDQAGAQLRNPVKRSKASDQRGRRLWSANCATCHGISGVGDGPVGPQMIVPDITKGIYTSRPDGKIFAVIHYGQNGMPRYGYKFSENEKWDLVNYVRKLQGN